MKINFADTEINDFEALPAGWYTVAVTDGEMKESGPNSKNPGSEYIHWEYTVQEGTHANRKVWDNTTLLPHALFSLKGLLSAAGFAVDGDLDFEIDDVIGKTIQVKLSTRDADNGNTYNDVKSYKAAGVAVGSGSSLLPS